MCRVFRAITLSVVLSSFGAFALTGSGVSDIAPLETIAPVFSGLTITGVRTEAGATVTTSFTASEPLYANPVVTVNGVTATFTNTSKGAVDYIYTCSINAEASQIVTVAILGDDVVGNPGALTEDVSLELDDLTYVPLRVWPLVVLIPLSAGVLMRRRSRTSGMAKGISLFAFFLFTLCCHSAFADAPSVTSVRFSQSRSETGGTQADIYYDLTAPNGPCDITVELSMDGGLDGYSYPVTTVSGDVVDVEAGTNRHIVWKIATDYPNVDIQHAQLRVTADDGRVQHLVTFNANGGITPVPESKDVLVGSSYGALATTSRVGYTFAGWWTEVSDGSEVTSDTIVAITAPQTLYARWTANVYTVTFNAQSGATPNPASKNVTFGNSYGTLATTSLTDYVFDGWFTAQSGGAVVTSDTTVDTTSDHTLFAHWTYAPLPAVTAFSINSDALTTTTAAVTLNNAATNSPTDYMASEAADFSGASWQTYASNCAFSLSTTLGGVKTVYFKVRNVNGESSVVSDTISFTEETVLLRDNVPLTVVWCPSGSFQMGRASSSELDSDASEDPQHLVTFSTGFWMGMYEVTQAQWLAIMENNPAHFTGDLERPVEQVSWTKITSEFLPALNTYTGRTFRLPSEAEWEYACRAGTTERFFWGDDLTYTLINIHAWYANNSDYTTQAVGTVNSPNAWGLYDMSGNVWEWCQDWYHDTYTGAPTNGSAWLSPATYDRVIRGGGWSYPGGNCRSASRSPILPGYSNEVIGFRIAR